MTRQRVQAMVLGHKDPRHILAFVASQKKRNSDRYTRTSNRTAALDNIWGEPVELR